MGQFKAHGTLVLKSVIPSFWRLFCLVAAASLMRTGATQATTYDLSPRRVIVLANSSGFVAQDAWNSLALYQIGSAKLVHRFASQTRILNFDVSSDCRQLVTVHSDGSIKLWDLKSGKLRWERDHRRTGLEYAFGVSFSNNGRFCIAYGSGILVPVLTSDTGDHVGGVRFPEHNWFTTGAVLFPDGSRGFLSDLAGHVFAFDIETGQKTDTGLTGAAFQISTNGKYLAFTKLNDNSEGIIQVVATADYAVKWIIGPFPSAGCVRAMQDGTFRFIAEVGGLSEGKPMITGQRLDPDSGVVEQLWSCPKGSGVEEVTDFQSKTSIGAATSYRLVTRIFDLRRGSILHKIDNSASYRPVVMSTTTPSTNAPIFPRPILIGIVVTAVVILLSAIWICFALAETRKAPRAD